MSMVREKESEESDSLKRLLKDANLGQRLQKNVVETLTTSFNISLQGVLCAYLARSDPQFKELLDKFAIGWAENVTERAATQSSTFERDAELTPALTSELRAQLAKDYVDLHRTTASRITKKFLDSVFSPAKDPT